MAQTLYALLVGINAYPPDVGALEGCVNDVDHFHSYLTDTFDKSALAIEVLKDADATRDNVIRQFRSHLGKATDGDVALFQYCGHGARWASAPAFREFYPEGKDEGLVCIDSRRPGGFDLADKELAILLSDVAKNNPHVAVVLDCCHSGSGTRGIDTGRRLRPRLTHEVTTERPLEAYLDGYYAALQQKHEPLAIPAARHILLAACERTQLAQETDDASGVFTSTLIDVLRKSAGDLTYADLFVRCRAAVRRFADNQDPQFEAYNNFNARSGFLGRNASFTSLRYSAYFDRGKWNVECGAIHGVPTDPQKAVALALYPEDDQAHLAGTATTVQVGPQKSEVTLAFTSNESVRYRAEITSLPVAPLLVYFNGDADHLDALQHALDRNDNGEDAPIGVTLTDIDKGARYALSVDGGNLLLTQPDIGLLIQGAEIKDGHVDTAAKWMRPVLRQVARWERSLVLQNPGTQLDASLFDFVFAEQLDGGQEQAFPPGDLTLRFARDRIRGKFKARNRTPQTLHVVLEYFTTPATSAAKAGYGIHILENDPIDPGDAWVTLWGDGPDDYFYLEDGINTSIESFKLFVSSEKIDDFLLSEDDLQMGKMAAGTRAIGSVQPMNKMVRQNEWFTRNVRVAVVRG